MATVPKILRFLNADVRATESLVWFACEDGKKYALPIANHAIGGIIDGLSNLHLGRREGDLLTLTVSSSQAAARPDGSKALLLTTQEQGTIAFALSDEGIAALLRDLAALQRVQKLTSKQ